MEFNKYMSPMGEEKLMEALAKIKHVALDMDGTIYMGMSLFPWTKRFLSDLTEMGIVYMGSTLFPYTIKFLDTLTANGISYSFLTNNPTKSHKDYLLKLEKLGIHATDEQMYTSSLATIDYIKQHHPEAKRLFTLGTPSMQEEFVKAGFELCADDPADRPDVLVVAFDTTLEYSRLCRATWWASKADIPYIATNPDWVCPTDQEVILVDCGSICKAIEGACKRKPDVVMACGPTPMLAAVQALCETYGVPCQLSLEERMGCGFGACMGCSCKTKYGNKRICKDGPVLEKEEIVW